MKNLNPIQNLLFLRIRKEDEKSVKLDCSLFRAMSELKNSEMSLIKIPKDFDKRLMQSLAMECGKKVQNNKFQLKDLLFNKKLNYSFAIVFFITLLFFINRMDYQIDENRGESSSVVIGNANFEDRPSVANFNNNNGKRFITEIVNIQDSKRVVQYLQSYYQEIGKSNISSELGDFIETSY